MNDPTQSETQPNTPTAFASLITYGRDAAVIIGAAAVTLRTLGLTVPGCP